MKCPEGAWYRAKWTQTRSWVRGLTGVALASMSSFSTADRPYLSKVRSSFWVKVLKFFDKQQTKVIAEVWTPSRNQQLGRALLFFPILPENFEPEHPLQALARMAE